MPVSLTFPPTSVAQLVVRKLLRTFFKEKTSLLKLNPSFCSIFCDTRGQMVIILHAELKKKISPTIKTQMTSM